MGYTHYFGGTGEDRIDPKAIEILVPLLKQKYNQKEICIEYNNTDTPPFINDEEIRFNGLGENGHETFYFNITKNRDEWCKTAGKPYDKIVTKVLWTLKHFHPEIQLDSDGELNGNDWLSAKVWLKKQLIPREKQLKTYHVEVDYHEYGSIPIEASSEIEAIQKAKKYMIEDSSLRKVNKSRFEVKGISKNQIKS